MGGRDVAEVSIRQVTVDDADAMVVVRTLPGGVEVRLSELAQYAALTWEAE
jgi:hypothetical protein